MGQNHNNEVPAYKRIQNAVLQRIESGEWKAGDAIDSERQLAKAHQVSLMTARHALAGLDREGMVVRRPGSGTFVAPPKIHFNKLVSYTELMASRGLVGCSRLLCNKIIDYAPEIAARLAVTPDSRLVKVERLRHAANEPFALEAAYLSAEEFGGLTSAPLARSSLFCTLEHDFGVELAHADEEVDATSADPRTAELLAVPLGAPLLRIRQVIYSTKGKATIYMLGFYRSDRHTLLIRRFR